LFSFFLRIFVNAKMINQNSKIARFKLKKLDEMNYCLWIMLVNPKKRVNLTFA